MTEAPTHKAGIGQKRPAKRPRLRRIVRPCETPRRKRRWLRICGWSFGGTSLFVVAAVLGIYGLFVSGLLSIDMARPYVERALEAKLGAGRTVTIGEIAADRGTDGGTLLRAQNITIRDAGGDVIATAPQAEVALQDRMMPWMSTPRRIDLVGVKLTVSINDRGELAIATGEGSKPLHAPAPAPTGPIVPRTDTATTPQASVLPGSDGEVATPLGPIRLASLAALADNIDRGGLDGGDLTEIGLKDGVLVVRSEASGKQWTFDHIDLTLSRPAIGGLAFDMKAGGTDGPWSAKATIGTLIDGQRSMEMEIRDLAPRDLMIAAGKADADLVATSPISVQFAAHMDGQGQLISSEGRLLIGAGELQLGQDVAGRMIIDEISVEFAFDPIKRVLTLQPFSVQSGPFALELQGTVTAPTTADGEWRLHTTSARASLTGGGPHSEKEPPFTVDNVALDLVFDPRGQRMSIEKGVLMGPQGGVTLQGALDLGAAEPYLGLSLVATPMSATSLKRMWPIVAAPEVRHWVYDHIVSGDVSKAEIAFQAPLASIGNKERPLPAEGLTINITGSKAVFRPIPELPPITGADIVVQATGRSAHVVATNAGIDTPDGRKLGLPEAVFDVPDTVPKNPPAKLRVSVDGPAAAALELSSMPPLRGSTGDQLDPDLVKGNIKGTAQINITLSEHITAADVDYAFDADLTDFSADKVFLGQKLDNATIRAFVTPAATVLRGDGKFGGAPASFEYSRPSTGDATFVVAASLDDAARTKLNLDLAGLSGTVGVKLAGAIGPKNKTADVDVDLTNARLAELIPGWSKPVGKPARLTAKANMTPNGTRLDDLVVTGTGVNIRGTVELDSKAAPISANLPTFQLSDGDKASVKVENADGVMKITVRGEVIEARAFLKDMLDAPIAGRKDEKPIDIDLDVNLGVVVGNNGEAMRQAVLKLSRRDGDMRVFSLGALVGREGGVTGDLKPRDNGRPLLRVATSDAGALLRFIDLYSRIYGGDLWIDVDAPRGDAKPQNGVINMRDFVIRGEAGLDRLVAAAPASMRDGRMQPGGAVSFRKLQVDFQRSAQQLNIREGAIWGPSIGSTFDGMLDFAADRISVRGTYVPAFGLNNLFSKLPVLGFFLGGGPNEGLVGVTYEIVGPLSGPTLRMNPISAVAPGFLRKIFEYRSAPDPTPPAVLPTR